MKIHGVSQTTGSERVIELSSTDEGTLFVFQDNMGHSRERIVTVSEALISLLAKRPEGQQTVIGMNGNESRGMKIEVRKNEVQLSLGRIDAAVGFDDLMNALAAPSA
jgi:hypothetical protein